jgi:hypothetical protein
MLQSARTDNTVMKPAPPTGSHEDREAERLTQLLDGWARAQSTTQGHAAAVLAGAISRLAFGTQRSRRFREAEAWCWSDDRREPLAFRNQCDALGIAPSTLRRHLRDLLRDRATRAARVRRQRTRRTNSSSRRASRRGSRALQGVSEGAA